MKFLKSLDVKYSTKLFLNRFRYKIVIQSSVAGWFRGANLDKIQSYYDNSKEFFYSRHATAFDKNNAKKLATALSTIDADCWQARVETPFVSIYLNTEKDLETIVKNCKNKIKYVEIPNPSTESKLSEGTVLVKKLDFGFKVWLGSSSQCYINFVEWCTNNKKVKLPKRAARDLSKNHALGGGFFYVKDEKTLTLVRMFLGRTITKIETVIKV